MRSFIIVLNRYDAWPSIPSSQSVTRVIQPLSTLAVTDSSPSVAIRMQQMHTQMLNASEEDIRQEILKALVHLQGLCVCCFFISSKLARNHVVYKCRTAFEHAQAVGKLVEVMPHMTIPFNAAQRICFSCYLPTDSFPDYDHAEGSKQTDDCDFRHILKPFVWISWAHTESRQRVVGQFKPSWKGKTLTKDSDWRGYYQWCCQRGPNDSMLPNYVFVFRFLFRIVSEKIQALP